MLSLQGPVTCLTRSNSIWAYAIRRLEWPLPTQFQIRSRFLERNTISKFQIGRLPFWSWFVTKLRWFPRCMIIFERPIWNPYSIFQFTKPYWLFIRKCDSIRNQGYSRAKDSYPWIGLKAFFESFWTKLFLFPIFFLAFEFLPLYWNEGQYFQKVLLLGSYHCKKRLDI